MAASASRRLSLITTRLNTISKPTQPLIHGEPASSPSKGKAYTNNNMLTSPKEDPHQIRTRTSNRTYIGFCQAVIIVCAIIVIAVNAMFYVMESSINNKNEGTMVGSSHNEASTGTGDNPTSPDNTFWGTLKGTIKDRIKNGFTSDSTGSTSTSQNPTTNNVNEPPNFCNPYDFPGYLDAQYRWNPFIPTTELSKHQTTPTSKNNGDLQNPCTLLRGPILDHLDLIKPNPATITELGQVIPAENKPLPSHLANKIVLLIGDSQDRNTVDTFCSVSGGEWLYIPLDGVIDETSPYNTWHTDCHVCIVRRLKEGGGNGNDSNHAGGVGGGSMPLAGKNKSNKSPNTNSTSPSTSPSSTNLKNKLTHDFLIMINVFHFGVERISARHGGFGGHIPANNRTPITTKDRISWIPYLLRNAAKRLFPEVCIGAPELCDACPNENGGFPVAPSFTYEMFDGDLSLQQQQQEEEDDEDEGHQASDYQKEAEAAEAASFSYEDEYHDEAAAGMEWFQNFEAAENEFGEELIAQGTTINVAADESVDDEFDNGDEGEDVSTDGGKDQSQTSQASVVHAKVLKPDAAKLAQEKLEAQNAGVVAAADGGNPAKKPKKSKYNNYNKKPGQRRSANPDANPNAAAGQFKIPKNPTPGLCLSRPSLIIAQSSLWDIEYWFGEHLSEPISPQEALDRQKDPSFGTDSLPFPGSLVHKLSMWSARIVAYLINPLKELFPNTPIGIRSCPLTTPDVYFPMWLVENMGEIAMDIGRKMGLLTFDWDRVVRGRNYLQDDGYHQNEESMRAFLQMIFSRLELMHEAEKAVADNKK
ncbi:hypothetical protein HDU76_011174 [Blyttiomyces sp. JEL0837]|nr:hypothetical protein HDU76_011174 [Blyttiomyces sp. JEL0837]